MKEQKSDKRNASIEYANGPLKTFFKTVKASTSNSIFDRIFTTGVSPFIMEDFTSGYNISKDIHFGPEFNDLCGFKQNEIEAVIKQIVEQCGFKKEKIHEAVNFIKSHYGGYAFAHGAHEHIYNPAFSIYFFKQFKNTCSYPKKILDDYFAVDVSIVEYIAQIPREKNLLMNLLGKDQQVLVSSIRTHFDINEILTNKSWDKTFLVSFLYYLGLLTIAGETGALSVILKIPNLVVKSIYLSTEV